MGNNAAVSRRQLVIGRAAASPAAAAGLQSYHVCSLIVHARPDDLADVTGELRAMSGVEIHGHDAAGKIVVTIETSRDDDVVQIMGRIGDLPGVLSTALVFQHFEAPAGG